MAKIATSPRLLGLLFSRGPLARGYLQGFPRQRAIRCGRMLCHELLTDALQAPWADADFSSNGIVECADKEDHEAEQGDHPEGHAEARDLEEERCGEGDETSEDDERPQGGDGQKTEGDAAEDGDGCQEVADELVVGVVGLVLLRNPVAGQEEADQAVKPKQETTTRPKSQLGRSYNQ